MVDANSARGKNKIHMKNFVVRKKTGNSFQNLVVDLDRTSNTTSTNGMSKYGMDSLGIRKIHVTRPFRNASRQIEGIY